MSEDKEEYADYHIIRSVGCGALELAKEVNEMMSKGYKPIGGIAVQIRPTEPTILMQAMLKDKN